MALICLKLHNSINRPGNNERLHTIGQSGVFIVTKKKRNTFGVRKCN